jgi:PIN domain nuclease of toxin-antitoxin system
VTFVLDTHVLLEWQDARPSLSRAHRRIIESARGGEPLLVSDISLWEIATLYELGRVRLDIPLRQWLESATAPPLVRRADISPSIAAEVASLPSTFHRDPADRIIVATARILGATLATSDQRIIDSGLVATR